MVHPDYQSPTQRLALKRHSPRKDDSPSRQLYFELERSLQQLALHDHECKKVHAYQRRTHHEELEARDLAFARAHAAAIDAATAKHDAVRAEAEAVLHRHLREQEEERRRKEEEERQRVEREAREKMERERKAKEEAERRAKEQREKREAEEARARQAAETKAKAEAEEASRKQREATAERERIERERVEREKVEKEVASKAQAEEELAKQRHAAEQQKVQAAKAISQASQIARNSQAYFSSPEEEAHHAEYLALHQKLKPFRKDFWDQAKQNPPLKAAIGDMRRAMRTSVGQLTDDRVGNRKASERVKSNISKALTEIQSPMVPLNNFLPPHLQLPDQNQQVPSLVIYLLSILSKAIVAAFCAECAVNPRAAEPIGTLAAHVFSLAELQFANPNQPQGFTSLIPILLCKFHRAAPILFGIAGPETTAEGRQRIGWRTEHDGKGNKGFVIAQRHHERMTGLGAGYASIALRNFSKTKLRNPYPPRYFWQSLSTIVNTPPSLVTTSHLLLLRSMLDNNAMDRFILFFGTAAIAALREALIDFPRRLSEEMKKGPAVISLGIMVDAVAKQKYFHLE